MPGLAVLGTGSYQPPGSITNAMLEGVVDTNDEWIVSRTGIRRRAMAGEEETCLSMAARAAKSALEDSGISLDEIAVVMAATLSGDYLTPSLACLLQRDLGLPEEVIAMDVNCACSGFVFALKTAHALLADTPEKKALVVGCELLTRITNYTDRGTAIIFGDGAGAAVIARTQEGTFTFSGGSRGDSEALACKAQYLANNPYSNRTYDRQPGGLQMRGQEVFRFALEAACLSVRRALDKAGVELEGVSQFLFHQANHRIVEGVARRLGVPMEKCYENIERTGNTSAASVAIVLDEANRAGLLKPGQWVVLAAFGGGLTYAAACLEWQGRGERGHD